ncbi:MAG: hypothetical protein EPN84_00160 [Legionella sp.]|nr:MAG: hypothetical protein EPN84_00160 [Legionella sp.]
MPANAIKINIFDNDSGVLKCIDSHFATKNLKKLEGLLGMKFTTLQWNNNNYIINELRNGDMPDYNTNCIFYGIDLSQDINKFAIVEEIARLHRHCPNIILVGVKNVNQLVSDNKFADFSEKNFPYLGKPLIIDPNKLESVEALFNYLHPIRDQLVLETKYLTPLQKTLKLLPEDSIIHQAVIQLDQQLLLLPSSMVDKRTSIHEKTLNLITKLKSGTITETDINLFEKDLQEVFGHSHPNIMAAVVGLISAILTTVLVTIAGFAIGVLCGAWTGPGAFLSGIAAAEMAACAVVTTSGLMGAGVGTFFGNRSKNQFLEDQNAIDNMIKAVQSYEIKQNA